MKVSIRLFTESEPKKKKYRRRLTSSVSKEVESPTSAEINVLSRELGPRFNWLEHKIQIMTTAQNTTHGDPLKSTEDNCNQEMAVVSNANDTIDQTTDKAGVTLSNADPNLNKEMNGERSISENFAPIDDKIPGAGNTEAYSTSDDSIKRYENVHLFSEKHNIIHNFEYYYYNNIL